MHDTICKTCGVDAQSAAERPLADATAYDRLVRRAGGRQRDLVAIVARDQSTVSRWKTRGIPADFAPDIVIAFEKRGLSLTLGELLDWIMDDRRRAPA